MPSNLVWSWPLHCNSKISSIFMGKDGLNRKRGHAIIGFNHGLLCYVKNMALGPQSRQKPRPSITSLAIVYSTVYSGVDQRKHQISASLAFVRGIRRGPVNSAHKWPVKRKMFPFQDVIMNDHTKLQRVLLLISIYPLRAKFYRGNITIYLHFVSFLHIDTAQVVEILLWIRQELTYST